jgi:DNA repair exonuclease SbcCD ATPase subunit
MESCDQLNESITKLDVLLKDPDNYIYEVFSELRRNVDLKYEEYKLRLDEETQKIRDELEKLENLCKEKLKSNDSCLKELRKAKEEAQNELDKHMSALNVLKVDENKWREIQQQCQDNIDCLEEQLCKFKQSLILNEFDLESFRCEFNVKIDVNPLLDMR